MMTLINTLGFFVVYILEEWYDVFLFEMLNLFFNFEVTRLLWVELVYKEGITILLNPKRPKGLVMTKLIHAFAYSSNLIMYAKCFYI